MNWKVYYRKECYMGISIKDGFKPDMDNYVMIGCIKNAESLDEVYSRLQAHAMPKSTCEQLAQIANHASMSLGDLIEDESGNIFVVDFFGFKKI